VMPVVDAGLVDLIEPDHRICPELSLIHTPGHTPGHCSIVIESQGERAIVTGDMMHHPIQFERPGDIARFDMNQQVARDTRVRFVDSVANSGTLIIGSHFNEPTGGYVVRDAHGCRLQQKK
jgi:glyoxylase-like metal-dependent hydrolase (beta-lactamase superfamily II)